MYELAELQPYADTSLLPTLTRWLLDAGQKIIASQQQLADQLRRILDERAIAESQRVQVLCASIKQLAFQFAKKGLAVPLTLEIETNAGIVMPMERKLWSAPIDMVVEESPEVYEGEVDLNAFHELANQFYVDERLLSERIEQMLEIQSEVTLMALVEQFPIEKGVAEVLTYVRMAMESKQHQVQQTHHDEIEVWMSDGNRLITLQVPHTVFRRIRA